MPLDSQLFRDTLAHWASGVTIVTTAHDNQWKGVTVSSFSSVSFDPPLVAICLNRKLYTHQLVSTSGVYAVTLLNDRQIELAKRFAGWIPDVQDRFEGLDCFTAETGSPIISGSLGWLDCKVVHQYAGGDHTIFVGEVLAAEVNSEQSYSPLLYHYRMWGQFNQLDEQ